MNPVELLRLVDSLHREKGIDSESVFQGIEAALLSAARKHLGATEGFVVQINRETGEIRASDGEREIDPAELGRIAAQTAKQVMIQKLREAERESISHDFTDRVHTVVTGAVQRFEGPNIIVTLPRTEGFLPKSEQIANETYHIGERLRAMIIEVRAVGTRIRVVLSRSHPEFVRRLFEIEVPEVGEGIVEIRSIAREAGYRTKIAVASRDPRVDSVGACVGVQGSRIKSIVDELNGEKIDIVPWTDQTDTFILKTLKPAEVESIHLDDTRRHALVIVPEDQLSLAIGKRGQNVRLASKLTGWDIDIKSRPKPEEKARESVATATPETAAAADASAPAEPASATPEPAPDATPEPPPAVSATDPAPSPETPPAPPPIQPPETPASSAGENK